jgi:hypothetical protein
MRANLIKTARAHSHDRKALAALRFSGNITQ